MDEQERRMLEEMLEEIADVLRLDDFIKRTEQEGVVVPLGRDIMKISLDSNTLNSLHTKKSEKIENIVKKYTKWKQHRSKKKK